MALITQKTGPQAPPLGSSPARLPENTRLYAIGDIHGCRDLLSRLHGLILDDAKDAPGARKVCVYIGDYIDRGPDSFGVIDMLIHEPLEGFERHHLKGNHEDLLISFLKESAGADMWLGNGGRHTLESYGIDMWGPDFLHDDFPSLRARLKAALPEDHLGFLDRLALYHREGDYLFVHAGIQPGRSLEEQSEFDMIWIRGEFLDCDEDPGFVVVHGHTVRSEPDQRPNRIGIDTGAYYSGRLTALVLEGESRRFLHT